MAILSERFGKRLKSLREDAGLSKRDLANKLGINENQIGKWERGDARPRPDMEDSLAEFFKIDPLDLYTSPDEGPTRGGDETAFAEEKDYVLIPLYDLEASAGDGRVVEEPREPQKHLAFQLSWIKGKKGLSRKDLLLVTVVGDSMEPTLREGDVVLVDRSKSHVPEDGLYVLRVDNTMLVKRLHKLSYRTLRVICDNDAYGYFDFDVKGPPKDLRVLGKVVWIGREI